MALRSKSLMQISRRHLGIEGLEHRNLLAVDMLANVVLDDGAVFRPRDIVAYQGQLLFRGDDGFVGPETWITSGDPADVRLLKDINTGAAGSGPRDFTEYQGRVFFAASNGGNGYELWVTQGSKASTQLMGDIWPGRESGVPTDITVFKGLMYFFANDGESGRELYQSDGTPAGTVRVADSVPGRAGSSGEQLTIVGDRMFFSSDSSADGLAGLWVSDGSAEGTMHLDVEGVNSPVDVLTPYGDRLLFAHDEKVYVTDGTVEGTQRLPNVNSNDGGVVSDGGNVIDIDVLGGRVFVTHSLSSSVRMYGPDLGTPALLANADGVEVASGRVYHWSSSGFYVLEPDNTSTKLLSFNSFFGTRLTNTAVVENGMLFGINRTLDRYEIWATNGTSKGTKLVENLTDTSGDPLAGFQQIGDSIYLTATNGNRHESLWKLEAPTIEAVAPPEQPALPGDVTSDRTVDARDIDAIFAAARQNSNDSTFDLNGDNSVTAADGNYIVESLLNSKAGDFDLNGKVDFADFLVLSTSFGKVGLYGDGDADGDGLIEFADFLMLSTNFGFDRDLA